MLSAAYPAVALTHIAKTSAVPVVEIEFSTLLQQRKYLMLCVPNISKPVMLTARQLECLVLVVKGYSDELAANKLQISRHTFYEHMRLVSNKVGARKRETLIQTALSSKIWL